MKTPKRNRVPTITGIPKSGAFAFGNNGPPPSAFATCLVSAVRVSPPPPPPKKK